MDEQTQTRRAGFTSYLVSVAVFGTGLAVAITLFAGGGLDLVRDATFVVFVVAGLVAVVIPIRLQRSGGVQAFTVEGGIVVAMLLAGFAPLAPAVLVTASALGHGIRTRSALKTMFNSGRSGLETGTATLVFLALAPALPDPTDLRSVLAAVTAAIAFEVVSVLVMTELFHRLSGARRDEVIRDVSRLSLITLGGNGAYGIVLASLSIVHVWVAALAASLMLVMYLGYRGYAAALEGQRRADAVNEVTHVLLDMVGREDGGGQLLSEVARVFGAHEGTLVFESRSGLQGWSLDGETLHRSTPTELPRTGLLGTAIATGRGLVERGGAGSTRSVQLDALAAPVVRLGRPVGVVAVTGRRGLEPWEEADASLLSAIANELGVALDNDDLFGQVEQERAQLEAETAKLNDILRAASDGIVAIGRDGSVEAWNPGMTVITGVEASSAIGASWHACLRIKDEEGTELAPTGDHVLTRAIDGGEDGSAVSLEVLRADGAWRVVDCTLSQVRQPDGTSTGVVLVARDVTTERELDELKADFIATVSHELRTPLTPLKGFLTTLHHAGGSLTDTQRDTIHGSMSSQLARLETLIADLLAVAELDHGHFALRPEPMDLGPLVRQAVDLEAADARNRCSVRVATNASAMGDPVAVVRVLRALVSNAIKHTDGAITVTLSADEEHVHVAVSDEGPGIASWDQQRVFGRFERLGNHLRRTQGPGLGLAIARSLAHRMGGDVTLTSELGAGTTFTMVLPRARATPVRLRAVSDG